MYIRDFRADDIKDCLAIYNYYIKNTCSTFEENPLTIDEFKTRLLSIVKNFPLIVAIENERVVGYAYLDSYNNRSAYRYTVDLSIYIDKKFIHYGIGSALLSKIEDIAKLNGFKNIIAIVTTQNDISVNFHKKNNYKVVGTLENVGYKFDTWLSVTFMQKIL